ncbi:MAG: DUF531 family protein [Candidatus Thermoplasmatota archaeon]
MADHPPTKARALVQDAKAGRRPITELLGEARAIADASFSAEALAALAEDPRLDAANAGRALTDAATALNRTERAFRKAEAGADVARRTARWRPGDAEAEPHRAKVFASLANTAQTLHGKDLVALAVPLAKAAPLHRASMLRLVLHHGADPIEDAKAVLAAGPGPGVQEALVDAPVAAQARLLAYHRAHGGETPLDVSLDAAARLLPLQRREALRAIIAAAPRTDLETIHGKLPPEPAERGRLLCALAAQADRTFDAKQARIWFDEAAAIAQGLDAGKERDAVLRNVEAGRARLAGATPAAPAPARPAPALDGARTAPNSMARHILALVDAYEGALGDVHFRALARAAPLCWAFGLDLALVGFPVTEVGPVVAKAGRATGIGEGGAYLERLAAGGRVHLMPATPSASPGFLVATTPKPDPAKAADFALAGRKAKAWGNPRLVVLIGLGPKGLPGEWMRAAAVHLELTGDNVSLETATAMGIIAERMRQLPPPTPTA